MVGCGRFGAAILDAARELPGLRPVAVADRDPERAAALAAAHRLDAVSPERLLHDDRVGMVAVATPPAGHAPLVLEALAAGRHVFCEKPLATRLEDATAVLRATARPGAPRLTVDYVLRRNPLYALLDRLRRELLGPPRRFALENLASDEHLGPDHWFWDREVSGGILVEHGVHFFDACAFLLGSQPELVQAVAASRPGGPVDTVVATALHPGGATASFAHAFARPARAELQWTTLDWGSARATLAGWIPVELQLEAWAGAPALGLLQRLAADAATTLAVPGYRPSGAERLKVELVQLARQAGGDHHLRLWGTLGGAAAKARVYRESVRAGLADLLAAIADGGQPLVTPADAWRSLAVALAAQEAADTGAAARPATLPPDLVADAAVSGARS
ncbi:MAG TPA: Gfo/Idh/MocA family oxidoreductase [Actinomycetes bacterium]